MKVNFLGDVFLDKQYKIKFDLNNYIFNLEYPLSKTGIPAKNKVNLGVDNSYILDTFTKFPIAVNLANNHIMDYGEESYHETINYLKNHNIQYFGAGNISNNFNNPCTLTDNNQIIKLFGYCCESTHSVCGTNFSNGSAPLDLNLIQNDISKAKDNNCFIVINLHWGDEEISHPKPIDIKIAKAIIDLGADLIIGHHAHVIQNIETYRGKKIFYGIGNFLFPNLNVPSMFNGKKFTNNYIKNQILKNRESIILEIDSFNKVTYKTTYFDNDKVILKKIRISSWMPKTQKSYDLYVNYSKKVGTIKRFLKNPKIPSLNQFKIFLGLK